MNIEKFYDRLYDWVIIYGPRFILGIIVLYTGLWAAKVILTWIQQRMYKKDVDQTAKPFILSLTGAALRVFVVLGSMQILGFQMTLFTTIIGAFGVAAGLALSGTLQNFASGIIILLLKPFVVGDNIVTQSQEGTVTSIQIFYTLITTFDNRSVIVPNSKLSNEVIINISKEGVRRLDLELNFPVSVDFNAAKLWINEAIDQCRGILAKPERRIGVGDIEGDKYKVLINVWADAHGFQDTKLAVQENLLAGLKKIKEDKLTVTLP